jgi:hypothetical protein
MYAIRLRPQKPNHVRSYDFVEAPPRMAAVKRQLTMIDGHAR